MSKYGVIGLAVVLVGPMLYQCINLCVDYYNEPVTTNNNVVDVDQSTFLSKLQFCFDKYNTMNYTTAQLMGLNETHLYFLQNYFFFNRTVLVPDGHFDNLTNETSIETFMRRLFVAWDEMEYDTIRITEVAINSTNPMEFWNLNQPSNFVPFRLSHFDKIDASTIVGPYTDQPSWVMCYDIPTLKKPGYNDYVFFYFNFSVNRERPAGFNFAAISPYIGDANVFDADELRTLDYVKDRAKYMEFLYNSYIVSIKKWTILNKRNRSCIEEDDRKVFFNSSCTEWNAW